MNDALRWDFFLAHAGSDKVIPEKLYELLAAHSHVFLDTRCLKPGDNWDAELGKAQGSAAVSLIFVSPGTKAAYYQREEIASALDLARNDAERHRVVPIFLSAGS